MHKYIISVATQKNNRTKHTIDKTGKYKQTKLCITLLEETGVTMKRHIAKYDYVKTLK